MGDHRNAGVLDTSFELESKADTDSESSSGSCDTFFTALDILPADFNTMSSSAAMPPPEGSSLQTKEKAVGRSSSFHFPAPLPYATITESKSSLTMQIIQVTDSAIDCYNSMSESVEEAVSALPVESLERYFCAASDLKNAVVMRRAAVLAELGRCTEYMSFLLSLYDSDDALLLGAAEKINLIQQASDIRQFNLGFWDLEYARSKLANSYNPSFMEMYGTLYKSAVESGRNNPAVDFGLQFMRDPTSLRDHRIRSFRRVPVPTQ